MKNHLYGALICIMLSLLAGNNLFAKEVGPFFIHATCEDANYNLCSDTSILKIYLNRFAKECAKKKGKLRINAYCDKVKYQKSYCTIPDLNFQIYYSKVKFTKQSAKEHCLAQVIGPYALSWVDRK